MKTLKTLTALTLIGSAMMMSNAVSAGERTTGRDTGPIIFVTSQNMYYDSIVLTDLPQKGEFQQLVPAMNGLQTEFGPGEPGHLGGRWWLDVNADGIMDSGDKYFLCPLLGPGRTAP